ncbi:hypothetical protein C8J56DRAFT_1103836 [Mycena floridula]|nr:hypothetical protein C8J56DRAFT_1103836 [Mycena floridula]
MSLVSYHTQPHNCILKSLVTGPDLYGTVFSTTLSFNPKPAALEATADILLGADWLMACAIHTIQNMPVPASTNLVSSAEVGAPPSAVGVSSSFLLFSPVPTAKGLYPPSLLPDYGGKIITQQTALLKQQAVFSVDEDLATLVMFKYPGGGSNKCRKVFQLKVSSMTILADSPEPVIIPKVVTFPDVDGADFKGDPDAEQPSPFKRMCLSL